MVSAAYFCSKQHFLSKNFSSEHVTQGLYSLVDNSISVEATGSLQMSKLSVDTQEDFSLINQLLDGRDTEYFEPSIKNVICRDLAI